MLRRWLDAGASFSEPSNQADSSPECSNNVKKTSVDLMRATKKARKQENSDPLNNFLKTTSNSYLATYEEGRTLEVSVLGGDDELMSSLNANDVQKADVKVPSPTRKPAWVDEDEGDVDDADKSVDVSKDSRYRKLKRLGETALSKKEYKKRLRKMFEGVSGPQPSWADLDQKTQATEDSEEHAQLFKTTGDYISKNRKDLPPTYLDYKPVMHANKSQVNKSTVSTVRFHPSSQVIMTASKDQHLSFFQVDGVKNAKIQTLFVEKFPIYCARFTADGSRVILTSKHRSFYEYDMMTGQLMSSQPIKALGHQRMSHFEMSPCGKYVAFVGAYGHINILSLKSKELICQLKMNGSVNSISFSPDSRYLYSFGGDGEVYVWEMSTRECVHKFRDDGCLNGTVIGTDPSHQFLACGSQCGVVNIYDAATCQSSSNPKPVKVVNNLLTQCTSLTFNSTSELLALGSLNTERSVKLVNTRYQTVYQNYPALTDTMACPTDIDFSPNSGYMAVGTNKGVVRMYRLHHFTSY